MEEDEEAGSVYYRPGQNLPPGYYPQGSIYSMRDSNLGSEHRSSETGEDLRGSNASISDLLNNPTVDRRGQKRVLGTGALSLDQIDEEGLSARGHGNEPFEKAKVEEEEEKGERPLTLAE